MALRDQRAHQAVMVGRVYQEPLDLRVPQVTFS
ncbi:unnamed protein product [Hydatigera taeniaeformis]|uniref:Uncharacterized protein n=1 Tax=Hydatigena taeniaeformis TaxID=6205 RepID=A0A3P7F5T3_HYDTA|nr:unnamed protein product [Hydatigera taeniaeformis]